MFDISRGACLCGYKQMLFNRGKTFCCSKNILVGFILYLRAFFIRDTEFFGERKRNGRNTMPPAASRVFTRSGKHNDTLRGHRRGDRKGQHEP